MKSYFVTNFDFITFYYQTATTLAKPLIEQLDAKLLEEDNQVQEKRRQGQHVEKLGFFAAVI